MALSDAIRPRFVRALSPRSDYRVTRDGDTGRGAAEGNAGLRRHPVVSVPPPKGGEGRTKPISPPSSDLL